MQCGLTAQGKLSYRPRFPLASSCITRSSSRSGCVIITSSNYRFSPAFYTQFFQQPFGVCVYCMSSAFLPGKITISTASVVRALGAAARPDSQEKSRTSSHSSVFLFKPVFYGQFYLPPACVPPLRIPESGVYSILGI